jgi:hypothetical protein
VAIFAGVGDLSFATPQTIALSPQGRGTYGVGIADLDSDGRLDLVTTNALSNNAFVYLAKAAPVLTSMSITPEMLTMTLGDTRAFVAVGHDQYGDGFSTPVEWSVSGGGTVTEAPTATGNLALGRPVIASSVQDGAAQYAPAKALDGSASSRWSSAFSDPQWIHVDLGAVHFVNRVVLSWESTAYGRAYEIQVSTDAQSWTPVFSELNGDGGVDDIAFPAREARHVRVYGTQRASILGYSLWELAVHGVTQSSAFTAAAAGGPFTVTAAAGGVDGAAEVTVVEGAVYAAAADFSLVQGQGGWFYLQSNGVPLTVDVANNRWKGTAQYLVLGSSWGHPGASVDAVRRLVLPEGGTAQITGTARDVDATGGNGVLVYIKHGTTTIWQATIVNGGPEVAFDVTVTVQAGDTLDFGINSRGNAGYDTTYFNPTVTLSP